MYQFRSYKIKSVFLKCLHVEENERGNPKICIISYSFMIENWFGPNK